MPLLPNVGAPSDFHTKAQQDYAQRIVENEAAEGAQRMLRKALGLGRSGRKKLGGGMLSIEISMTPARPR